MTMSRTPMMVMIFMVVMGMGVFSTYNKRIISCQRIIIVYTKNITKRKGQMN